MWAGWLMMGWSAMIGHKLTIVCMYVHDRAFPLRLPPSAVPSEGAHRLPGASFRRRKIQLHVDSAYLPGVLAPCTLQAVPFMLPTRAGDSRV
jgi:hypothetical protein